MKSVVNALSNKCNNIMKKSMVLFFGIIVYPFSLSALPIISGIEIFSGDRGIAVSFDADSVVKAKFYGNKKQVSVIFEKSIYGLTEFIYDKFDNNAPIKNITIHEKSNTEVEITIVLKYDVVTPIQTIQKKNKWVALVSKEPVREFTWKVSNTNRNEHIEKAIAQPLEKKAELSALNNIRLLERGHICELAFEFDKEVSGTIKRKNNSITLYVENSLNKIGKNNIILPTNTTFKKLSISQNEIKGKSNLTAVFVIDTSVIESDLNVAFTQGEVLSFLVTKRDNKKATLWTSGHGLMVDYNFYDVPSYNVDMKRIRKRAEIDTAIKLSRKSIFSVNNKAKMKDKETVAINKNEIKKDNKLNNVTEAENAITNVKAETATVIANNVNIRKIPSLQGAIAGRLQKGDMVNIVGDQKKWVQIIRENDTGYVYAQLLRKTALQDTGIEIAYKEDKNEDMAIKKVSTTQSLPIIEDTKIKTNDISKHVAPIQDLPTLRKKTIQYQGRGRDPFMPLDQDSMIVSTYPIVENLNLVGVLLDDIDKIALCEDTRMKNKPFALREHDPVYKGKVLKIYRDKMVFLLTEYGISRSFTINLEKKQADQEVSKK